MSGENLETKIVGSLLGERELCRNAFYRVDYCDKKGYKYSRNKGEYIMRKPDTVPGP